ncbi:MAG: protein kinase [Anaerolineae bacterium]|nr:protein kinase [Anaerolineae bacterium]
MKELIGSKLGQYQITGLLGKGGMAVVYRAHQETIVRDVAIKVIKSDLADEGFVARFQREARTIAALDHPHILKIHDFGRDDDQPYLVMELKSGGSLAQKIARSQGRISPEEVSRYLDQIAPALDYAHSKGVIHRDLKPQNVLLDESDNAFLTDFGIAKLLNDSTVLTHSGLQMGTPGYMAPEQWYGQQIDSRTDLYALAVMVYEILTGKVPFDGDTPAVLMYQQLNEAPLPLRTLRPDLPLSLEKVLIKAMAKQPDQRYQSAAAFAEAFGQGLRGKTPAGIDVNAALRPITPPNGVGITKAHPTIQRRVVPEQKHWSLMAMGAGLIALLGLLVVFLSIQDAGVFAASGTTTPSLVVIAAEATDTIPPSLTATASPSPSLTATATASLTPSATDGPTHTATALATHTPTRTSSHTATISPTASRTPVPPTETATPNQETLIALILATETQRAADIIASYTATSSPIPSETPDQIGTARAAANQTMTAVVVLSFTPTFTSTPTFTPSFTPSSTYTPSSTPTITSTVHQGAFFVVTSDDEVIYAWEGPWRGDKSVATVLKGDRLPVIAAKRNMDVFVWCIVRLPSGIDAWISTRVGEIQPESMLVAGIAQPATIPAARFKPSATPVPTNVPTAAPGWNPPPAPNPTDPASVPHASPTPTATSSFATAAVTQIATWPRRTSTGVYY